jgi:hypothetical protein
MENKDKLPVNAIFIEIKGGNHSQFGYLGRLFTDLNAEIELTEQQRLTAQELVAFFKSIDSIPARPDDLSF